MADWAPGMLSSGATTLQLLSTGDLLEEGFIQALRQHGADVRLLSNAAEATPEADGTVFFAVTADEAAVLLPGVRPEAGPHSPVVVILTNPSLEDRLRFEALELVRVLPRMPSVDALAAGTLRRMRRPSAAHYASGAPGVSRPSSSALAPVTEGEEASLDELTALIRNRLRNGILRVSQGDEDVRLVIRDGRPLSSALEDFVERIRANVSAAEPLHYDFIEALTQDDSFDRQDVDRPLLSQLRFLLLDQDPARADLVAQTLRAAGAEVLVARAEVEALAGARGLYPDVVLVGADSLASDGLMALRALKSDLRLRWSALVVVHWDDVLETPGAPPSSERIALRLGQVHRRYAALASAIETHASVEHALAHMGPVQLLRFLARHPQGMLVEAVQDRQRIQVAVSEGLVVGATVQRVREDSAIAEGLEALATYLALESGTVTIQKRARPFKLNLMLEVDQAVADAQGSRPSASPLRRKQTPHGSGHHARTLPAPLSFDDESTEASADAFSSKPPQVGAETGKAISTVPKPPRSSPPIAPLLQRLRSVPGGLQSGERGRALSMPKAAPTARRAPRIDSAFGGSAGGRGLAGRPSSSQGSLSVDYDDSEDITPNLAAPSLEEAETIALTKAARERAAALEPSLGEEPTLMPTLGEEPTLPAKLDDADNAESDTHRGSLRAKRADSSEASSSAPEGSLASPERAAATSASYSSLEYPPAEGAVKEKSSLRLALILLLLGAVAGASAWYLLPAGTWARVMARAQTLVQVLLDDTASGAPEEESLLPFAQTVDGPDTPPGAEGAPQGTPDARENAIAPPPEAATADGAAAEPAEVASAPPEADTAKTSAETSEAPTAGEALSPGKAKADKSQDTSTAPPRARAKAPEPEDAGTDDTSDETDARVLVIAGQRYAREGNSEAAAAAFRKALSMDANNNRALFGLGELALAAGVHGDAVNFLERAVALRPKRAPFRVVYGDALAAAGKRNEAVAQWRLALRLEPGNREARARLK